MKKYYALALVSALLFSITSFSQWEPVEGPYFNVEIQDLQQHDSVVVASTKCGLFVKGVNSKRWERASYSYTRSFNFSGDSVITYTNKGYGAVNLTTPPFKEVLMNAPGIQPPRFWRFATNDSLMLITTLEGVEVSNDYGLTAQTYQAGLDLDTIVSGSTTRYSIYIAGIRAGENHVYLSTNKGVYRSDYALSGWVPKNNGLNMSNLYKIYEFGGVQYASSGDSIFKSINNGDTWSGFYGTQGVGVVDFLETNGDYFIVFSNDSVVKSTDQGATWQDMSVGLKEKSVVAIRSAGSSLYTIGLKGLYLWNGTTWQPEQTVGMYCSRNASVQATSTNIIATNWDGVAKLKSDGAYEDITPRQGEFWTYGVSRVKNDTLFVPARYENYYAGLDSSKLFFTSDNGVSWSAEEGPGWSSNSLQSIPDIRFYDDTLYMFVDNELFYTADLGKTWVDISPNGNFCNYIDDIIKWNGELYLTGCPGNGVSRYDQNANVWKSDGQFPSGSSLLFLERDSVLFLTYVDDIRRRMPNTSNWISVTNGIGQFYPYMHFNHNQYLYFSSSAGLFTTDDYGDTWTDFNDGWADPEVMHPVHLAVLNDTLYVGTVMQGVFKRAVPPNPISLREESPSEKILKLYPNPVSTEFIIDFGKAAFGTYQIHDQGGKLLVEGTWKSNEPVSVANLNSGLYYITVEADGQKTQGKFIVEN